MEVPTVAACQLAVADLDVEANLATVAERVAGLPERVDLAVFPEQALTGFVADERIHDAAIEADGPVVDRIRALAADQGVDLLVGAVTRTGDSYHNAALYVDPDGSVTRYHKRHLWAGERAVLDPGEDHVVVDTPLGSTGIVTCYDLNFVAESAALTERRVDALLVLGAWPAAHATNWRLLVRARALDGARWAVAAARTGRRDVPDAPVATYAGRSLVAHPDGSVRAALATGERDLVADLDPATFTEHRERVGIFPKKPQI